jgi:hypothetical protein
MSGVPPLVALFMSQPSMIDRLDPQHADDGTGHCRSCTSGGQSGRDKYPCSIRNNLDQARRRLPDPVVPV